MRNATCVIPRSASGCAEERAAHIRPKVICRIVSGSFPMSRVYHVDIMAIGDFPARRYPMRRSVPVAGSMWLLLAFTAAAATEVTNEIPGPLSEFGAAAIRGAAGGLSLGRVAISVAKD